MSTLSPFVLASLSFLPVHARDVARTASPAEARRAQALEERVPEGYTRGVPWTGAPGITETVAQIMARDALLPKGALRVRQKREHSLHLQKSPNPLAPAVAQWPPAEEAAPQGWFPENAVPGPYNPQTVGTSFLGIQLSEGGFIPPDSVGDVSTTQVLVSANSRIKVFNKAGVLGGLNTTNENFFASVGGLTNGTSDPHIRFDRLSGRWFVTIIDLATVNHILIAVSTGSTITSGSSFTFFSFQHDLIGTTPNADTNGFADYDTLGVDKFALYMGANIFDGGGVSGFSGTTGYVINKANLIGGTLTVTAFRGINSTLTCSGITDGVLTPQGVNNDDPNATEGYIIGVDICDFSELTLRRVINPGTTPSISGNIVLTVPTTTFPINQVQPAGPTLDALDDRLFAAGIFTNKITGAKTLWTAHNIQVNSSGVGSNTGGRNGSRWYEIGSLTTTPTLVQSGTVFDSAGTTPFGFWIPSTAMTGQGHMGIAFSRASASSVNGGFASVAAAGRLRTDTLGSTQLPPTLAQASTFNYDTSFPGTERWGDYSQTVVDPTDGQTIWTFQEYANATNSWGVRAIQLRAPLPATPSSASPSSVAGGQSSVNVTITGTSTSGTEFFDPGPDTGGPGFPNHIAGAVSGGVVVNSATFVSTTQVTLNLNTSGVTPGTKNVTITNPDGQSATGNNILTVTCQAMTVNPTSIPSGTAGTVYNQVFSQTGGLGSSTFSLTGTLPTGMTFTPGTATLSGTPTQTGTFPITVTATDANGCQGSRNYNLVIGCQTIAVNPSSIASGKVGTAYSQMFTQTGGVGTTSFSLTGTLPTGLSFTTPTLSGNPSQAGSFPIIVTVNDAPNNCKRDRAYTLVVSSSSGTAPVALAVDAAGNGVFDSSEQNVTMAPSWFNNSGGSVSLTGSLSSPSAGLATGADTTASYGTISDGFTNACTDCYTTMSNNGVRPTGQHWDGSVTETPSTGTMKSWTLHIGGSFGDVSSTHPNVKFIETLFHKGVTSGCAGGNYCPADSTLRKQMAVFLLKSKLGSTYTPPACTTPTFADVPCSDQFAVWIYDLVARGVTSGCGGGNYCPNNSVTRAQMAIFLLRTLEGLAYVPPACSTPPFADVPTTDPFCIWIQEVAARAITSGCGGGNYCPTSAVTRAQMAVFLTRTFGLLLYGP